MVKIRHNIFSHKSLEVYIKHKINLQYIEEESCILKDLYLKM